MTIKTLAARGATNSHIARLLGVTEGAVRHHIARLQAGALDGRSRQEPKAACVAAAIDHWRQMQEEGPINLAVLHAWLVSEHGYSGSLRSIQRYWSRTYPAPALRARRRVETPPGAQAQVDWAHFPAVLVGGLARDLVALHMVLSWSRKAAIVWSETKNMLAWLGCQTACFTRLGGVPATVRIDMCQATPSFTSYGDGQIYEGHRVRANRARGPQESARARVGREVCGMLRRGTA